MKADFGVKNSEPPHGRQNYFRPEESLLDKEAYIGPVTSVSLDSAPFQCSKVKNIAPRHVLLVGRGPWVEIYCEGDDEVNFEAINSNHLVFECQEGGTIHGMRKCAGVFCDGVDGRNKDLWLLYGGKCIAFVTLDPESLTSAHDTGRHDNCFQKLPIHGGMYDESNIRYHFKVSDWIWDTRAVILNDTKGMSSFDILVALGLANNTVHLVNFSSTVMNGRWSLVPTIQRKVVCEIRCINYCQSLFGWAPSSSIINREELDLAIAVGTVSNEILVWNVLNEYEASELNGESTLIVKKRVIHRLIGHEGVIHSIHIGAGGKYIVSTSDDRTVRLWVQNLDVATDVSSSAETHLDVRRMVGHECCYTMLWSAYGHHARIWDSAFISLSNDYFDEASGGIVSTGEDSTIRLWRISDGKELAVLRGHRCKSIWKVTSDRKGTIITGGNDGTAKVWDVDYHLICNASYSSLQKKAITPFCGIRTEIIPSDDSNSDPIIVSDTNENEKKTSSGMVLPVDYKNVKKSNAKRGQNIFGFEFYGGDPHRKLIMASRSGSLISFDLSTCKWVKHGSWSKGITTRVYAVNPTNASCIAVHPCNNVIAVGTSKGEVILSSISDTENVHKLLFSSHKYHGIRSLHWLDSYNMLAFHVNGIILWWKLDIFSSEMDLEYCSVRKPSLRFVLSMKRDGLKVGSPTAYFHDNKTKLFYVGDSRGNISVFDCESGKVDGSVLSCLDIISFAHKKEHVTDIIASSNGKGIISVGNDGFLHEAHLVNHSGRIKLLSILRRPVSCLSNISFIWRESSKSKGEKIIVGGYNGNRFIVWNLSMGYQLLNIDSGLRNRQMKLWIQFHDGIRPASHCLAILVSDKSGPEKLFMHSHLHYINRASPSLYNLGVPCHGETILDVALLQCEARHKILMATGSNDCRIKLHCLEGMRSYLIIELPPHESCVRAVCFSKHNGSKSSLLVTTGGKLQMSFYRIEEQIDESFDVTFLGRSVPLKKPEVDQRMNAVHALPLEDCANYCMKSHIVLSGASDGALHLMEVVEHDGHSKRPQKLINLFQGK
jgi:WD40 repeat protein